MKKLIALITVLAGGAAIVATIIQKMGRTTRIWMGAAGATGVVGKGPNAVFAVKRLSVETLPSLFRKVGCAISSAGAAYLYKKGKK